MCSLQLSLATKLFRVKREGMCMCGFIPAQSRNTSLTRRKERGQEF